MKKTLLVLSALCWILAAVPGTGEAATYRFSVQNSSTPPVGCGPLEIKILNNGQQVAGGFSPQPLVPKAPPQSITLSAETCSKIQLKTVCAGQVNFHEKSCLGGNITILSATEMAY